MPHLSLREHAEDSPAESFRLLDEFGVGHRLDARPIELSGGEQARAAFALALARRTPLVVVDEPTAELDRPTAALLLDAMRRHTAAGMAFAVARTTPTSRRAPTRLSALSEAESSQESCRAHPPRSAGAFCSRNGRPSRPTACARASAAAERR